MAPVRVRSPKRGYTAAQHPHTYAMRRRSAPETVLPILLSVLTRVMPASEDSSSFSRMYCSRSSLSDEMVDRCLHGHIRGFEVLHSVVRTLKL